MTMCAPFEPCDVVIIGAGIGGLTSALALQRQGFKVAVFEEAQTFGEVGAGITLGSTACRGLYALGLREDIEREADAPQVAIAVNYLTGEPEGARSINAAKAQRVENPFYRQMHRADLHRILLDAVRAHDPGAVTTGCKLIGYEPDGAGVTARFSHGGAARGTLMIGADGINSVVRGQMFGVENARFTHQVAYRFLAPMEAARPFMSIGASVKYAAPLQSLLRYAVRKGALVNGVAFVHTDSWRSEGWSTPASTEELLSLFQGWHPDVLGLIRAAPVDGTRKWALFDRDPLSVWTQGRVALLGDAAHPMLPFLGLGAAMGIEDAVVLGRALGAAGLTPAGLKLYEAARKDRAAAVLLGSRCEGEIRSMPNPDAETLANRPSADIRFLNYDPVTAPLPVPA
jgi:salicylate hydroxylase